MDWMPIKETIKCACPSTHIEIVSWETITYPLNLKPHIHSTLMILSQAVITLITLKSPVAFYDIVSSKVLESHSSSLELVHNWFNCEQGYEFTQYEISHCLGVLDAVGIKDCQKGLHSVL